MRDEAIGILATGPLAMHQALLWRQLSKDVVVFSHTHAPWSDEDLLTFAARDIIVVEGLVTALESTDGEQPGDKQLTGVRLEDGTVIPRRALAVATGLIARSGLLAALGLEPVEQEMNGHVIGTHIPADPTGKTDVPGVWVAGNISSPMETVIGSAAAGARAGMMINGDLVQAETAEAVAEFTRNR